MNWNLAPARQDFTPSFRWYCAAIPREPNGYTITGIYFDAVTLAEFGPVGAAVGSVTG